MLSLRRSQLVLLRFRVAELDAFAHRLWAQRYDLPTGALARLDKLKRRQIGLWAKPDYSLSGMGANLTTADRAHNA